MKHQDALAAILNKNRWWIDNDEVKGLVEKRGLTMVVLKQSHA